MTTQTPARYAEATSYFQGGRMAEAQIALEECVREVPSHVGAHFGLAVCLDRAGDLPRAEESYRTVLALDPRHVNGHIHLGQLLARQGRTEEAAAEFRTALSIEPASSAAQQGLASLQPATQATTPMPAAPDASAQQSNGLSTLAAALDSDALEQTPMAGNVVHRGHRRVLSHRRVWLAVLLLVLIPLLGVATRQANNQVEDGNASAGTIDAVRAFGDFAYAAQFALGAIAALLIAAALLSSALTTYTVRERRIEIAKGVLFRTERSIWLYDVNDIVFSQTPLLVLSGTGKLTLMVDESNASSKTAPTVVGFRSAGFMRRLSEELQPMVLRERRAMKKQFV